MIERYSRREIKKIWEEKNKYQIWLDIEIAAAQAMEKLKIIPKGVSSKTRKKAKINIDRIHEIEKKVHHDVIAFLTSITEKVGNEGKFLHKGMTSSDILGTCFNMQLIQAGKILVKDINEILKVSVQKNYLSTDQSSTRQCIDTKSKETVRECYSEGNEKFVSIFSINFRFIFSFFSSFVVTFNILNVDF